MDKGLVQCDAEVVDEILGGIVVGGIEDEVIRGQEFPGVVAGQAAGMRFEADMGIQRAQAGDGGLNLGPADVGGGVQDLALEIGDLHDVGIDEAQQADAGGGEIEERGGTEAAAADDQDAAGAELFLGAGRRSPAGPGGGRSACVLRRRKAWRVSGSGKGPGRGCRRRGSRGRWRHRSAGRGWQEKCRECTSSPSRQKRFSAW
jgi:hypothetical protein